MHVFVSPLAELLIFFPAIAKAMVALEGMKLNRSKGT